MSKRIVKPLVLLLPLVVAFASFAATAAADRGRDGRAAVAFGKAQFTVSPGQDERFRFFAKDRGGLPANDRGFIFYRNATAGFAYDADLDCVAVSGKTARFGYVIPSDPGVPAAIRGLGVVFQVVDNGTPGAGRDLVGYVTGPAAIAAACETTPVPNLTAIREGNIVVRPGKGDRHKPKPRDDKDDDTDDTDDSDDTDTDD